MKNKWKVVLIIVLLLSSFGLTVYYYRSDIKNQTIPVHIDSTDQSFALPWGDDRDFVLEPKTAFKMAVAFYEDLCSRNDEYKDFNPYVDMVVENNTYERYWYIRNEKPQNQKYYFLIIDAKTARIKALWTESAN